MQRQTRKARRERQGRSFQDFVQHASAVSGALHNWTNRSVLESFRVIWPTSTYPDACAEAGLDVVFERWGIFAEVVAKVGVEEPRTLLHSLQPLARRFQLRRCNRPPGQEGGRQRNEGVV